MNHESYVNDAVSVEGYDDNGVTESSEVPSTHNMATDRNIHVYLNDQTYDTIPENAVKARQDTIVSSSGRSKDKLQMIKCFGLVITFVLLTIIAVVCMVLVIRMSEKVDELSLKEKVADTATQQESDHCANISNLGGHLFGQSDLAIQSERQVLTLSGGSKVVVRCVDGKRWVVFQSRSSPEVDFYLDWKHYISGFGDLAGNFWLGLDVVHRLCHQEFTCELRIDMTFEGTDYFATYQNFWLSGPSDKYRLHVEGYVGTAGDALTANNNQGEQVHNGMQFTTRDADHDTHQRYNCAEEHQKGGWWYGSSLPNDGGTCSISSLNDPEYGSREYGKGLTWEPLTTYYKSLTFSEMKLRIY